MTGCVRFPFDVSIRYGTVTAYGTVSIALLGTVQYCTGDVVVLYFFAEGRHLVVDAVVTTVHRNTIFTNASTIHGYVAKQVEDMKFMEIGRAHV